MLNTIFAYAFAILLSVGTFALFTQLETATAQNVQAVYVSIHGGH